MQLLILAKVKWLLNACSVLTQWCDYCGCYLKELMELNLHDGGCVLQQTCLQNLSLWVSLCAYLLCKNLGDKVANGAAL